ncbi:M20 family metallo-hydrolase [Oleiharenicola lentus]|uniref:M20 family metallo-hydrolase n=1 Tax=Oleiharenicola lentus TaxID=2508720 RepID=UPI003F66DB26
MSLQIDSTRLSAELEYLARISDTPYPSVTRVLFSEVDLRAREWLKQLYADAGLVVREDAVGNTFARWVGTDAEAAPVATGSHIDAIPNAGMYDGVVGVLGGLEAIRALQRGGKRPRRSIELVMFTAEEPTRFGLGCLGSRLMAGTLSREKINTLRDPLGLSVDDACARAYMHGTLEETVLPKGCYDSFVELHIEQGPLLERQKLPIGVVTAIAAPAAVRIELSGPGGHAGTVLMTDRHDPSLAAAEIMLAVDQAARATQSRDTVATCGLVHVLPGAVNSIPREVKLEIDVRDIDGARRDGVLVAIRAAAKTAAERYGCGFKEQLINADPPAACAPHIISAVEESSERLGLASQRMISRAYHDSLFMAQVCPTSMIFVPSKDGISHRPDEYSSPEEIANGVAVLAGALDLLANN